MPETPDHDYRSLCDLETAHLRWQGNRPVSLQFDDIYYSGADGVNESEHVFIGGNRLRERWQAPDRGAVFTIGETGFGTGLNFLLAARLWREIAPKHAHLHYVSAEKHPLALADLTRALSSRKEFADLAAQLLARYPEPVPGFHRITFAPGDSPAINLTLIFSDAIASLEQLLPVRQSPYTAHAPCHVDAWFLDGFAPAKNDSMWQSMLFEHMASLSHAATTFATFTAAGHVRRSLEAAGFAVRKTAGFGQKRDMLIGEFRAVSPRQGYSEKADTGSKPGTPAAFSPSARPTPSRKAATRKAAIIGGGLAGCTTARALAQRNWHVTLFEKLPNIADAGSGNTMAVTYPKLSHRPSAASRFNLAGITYAANYYAEWWHAGSARASYGERCGVLVLPKNEQERATQTSIANNFRRSPRLLRQVDQAEVRRLSGLPLAAPTGLYYPSLGWINPQALCRSLCKAKQIRIIHTAIDSLLWDETGGQWQLIDCEGTTANETFDAVVIASSNDSASFTQTAHLPLKALRGQVSTVDAAALTPHLKTVVCGEGYIGPRHEGSYTFGASYNFDCETLALREQDHHSNIDKLQRTDPALTDILGQTQANQAKGRAGLRCVTPDYLPIVGPAPVYRDFIENYAILRRNARAEVAVAGSYWPNLYLHCGLGSRGAIYAPIGAQLLADIMCRSIPTLPRDLQHALHPARFIIRGLKQNKL